MAIILFMLKEVNTVYFFGRLRQSCNSSNCRLRGRK